jgi:hypothetical protein
MKKNFFRLSFKISLFNASLPPVPRSRESGGSTENSIFEVPPSWGRDLGRGLRE